MPYILMFGTCYVVTLIAVLTYIMRHQASVVRRLIAHGATDADLDEFRQKLFLKTLLVTLWTTFLTGSILGTVISGVYLLATR
jgi:hypothetical protein